MANKLNLKNDIVFKAFFSKKGNEDSILCIKNNGKRSRNKRKIWKYKTSNNGNRGMIKVAEEKNKTIKEVKKEVEYLTGEEEIKRLAELREKWAMDRRSEISDAREEGKKEEKLAIAKNMLNKGISEEDILDFTGISKEELEKLKQ